MFFILFTLVIFSVFALSLAENADVTVEDDSPLVVYTGEWHLTTAFNALNSGGFHHLSDDKSALAAFSFTGVAVSFLAPKWPYRVGVQLSIDSYPPETVDLRDYTGPFDPALGNETVASSIVWSKEGLNDTQHNVWVSFPKGEFDFVVVDAFVVTPRVAPPPGNDLAGIIGGGVAGLIVFVFAGVLACLCYRRRRRARIADADANAVSGVTRRQEDVEKAMAASSTTNLVPKPPKAYQLPRKQRHSAVDKYTPPPSPSSYRPGPRKLVVANP